MHDGFIIYLMGRSGIDSSMGYDMEGCTTLW